MAVYTYQIEIGQELDSVLTLYGEKIQGTGVTTERHATMEEIKASSKKAIEWYNAVSGLAPIDEKPPAGKPFELTIRSLGKSNKIEFIFQADTLKRRIVFEGTTATIDSSDPFDIDVASWLLMHDTYAILSKVVEGVSQ